MDDSMRSQVEKARRSAVGHRGFTDITGAENPPGVEPGAPGRIRGGAHRAALIVAYEAEEERRRARADTVGTVIVGSPTRWRPTFDDETEDEAEDIKEEEEPVPARPAMGSEDSGAPTLVEIEEEVQARNVAAKERKIAQPNAGVAAKAEQPSIAAGKPKHKKKKTKWSKRLLCGMA